jgi:hypothetical protein
MTRVDIISLWGMVTGSAEPDDGKPKNIMELNQLLMSFDCLKEIFLLQMANRSPFRRGL